ncbi:hypothetical protein [Burkholderia pseudomallei]|uniref:hypothetical protein n=1 Tax=Burkholderia pseudomallei TaxID=28450 RepID=UPI0022EA1051|nr:hypothetical protein [Burkholderia pseudomallei]
MKNFRQVKSTGSRVFESREIASRHIINGRQGVLFEIWRATSGKFDVVLVGFQHVKGWHRVHQPIGVIETFGDVGDAARYALKLEERIRERVVMLAEEMLDQVSAGALTDYAAKLLVLAAA